MKTLAIAVLALSLHLSFAVSGALAATYGGGTGTAGDPYLICSAEQMNDIGLNPADWDKHFKLIADIDLSSYVAKEFNIIGTGRDNPFTGVFNGNGRKILNFHYASADVDYIGIFGCVGGQNPQINGLALVDPNVGAGTGRHVGCLAGYLEQGTITNCCVEGGTVSGGQRVGALVGLKRHGTIKDSHATASVTAESDVGGLVGRNLDGPIDSSYACGDVSGKVSVGGLVGLNYATISHCYAVGNVNGVDNVGGLAGLSWGMITDSYFSGEVSGNEKVGGLAGEESGIMTRCSARAAVSGVLNVGGLVGNYSWGTSTNCHTQGNVKGNEYVGGLVGYNVDCMVAESSSTSDVSGEVSVGGLAGGNSSMVANCYATGGVAGRGVVGGLVGHNAPDGIITRCYSVGSVLGATDVGGLVGLNDHGMVDSCFWDVQASGQMTSAGGAGKTTAEMETMSTFTEAGWDFAGESENGTEDIWAICSGTNYPRFVWQIPTGDFVCPDGVGLNDFACLARHWLDTTCQPPNSCDAADLDHDGTVNYIDLAIFAEHWLEGI